MIWLESLNVGSAEALMIGDKVAQGEIRKVPVTSADLCPHGFVGDTAEPSPNPAAAPSVLETFRWFYDLVPEIELLREALKAPLATHLRGHLERKLDRDR